MRNMVALALLAWTAVCGTAFAQSAGLEVFPQMVEMQFPQGYDVYSDAGKLLKTVPGPTSATVQAKASGKQFAAEEAFLSDWSYEQLQQGKSPNWIAPKSSVAAAAVTQTAASVGGSTGLVVYPALKEVTFPEGYNVFSDDGQLIKTVPGPTSIALKGETGGKAFANGTVYLSDWSYDQLRQGKKPNWVVSGSDSAASGKLDFITGNASIVDSSEPESLPAPVAVAAASAVKSLIAKHSRQNAWLEKKSGSAVISAGRGMQPIKSIPYDSETGQVGIIYAEPIEAVFPDGFEVYSTSGKLLSRVAGRALVKLKGGFEVSGIPLPTEKTAEPVGNVFITQAGYEAMLRSEDAYWIFADALSHPIAELYDNFFRQNSMWDQVDLSAPVLESLNASTTAHESVSATVSWVEITGGPYTPDEANVQSLVSSLVEARIPQLSELFREAGKGYGSAHGGYWKTFDIDGFSHAPELATTHGDMLRRRASFAVASLSKEEREWLVTSLPSVYQAIIDVFRNDVESAKSKNAEPISVTGDMLSNSLFLRFYRSPSFAPRTELPTYVRWGCLRESERRHLVSVEGGGRPSFYGVQVYAGGKMVGNYPLFGAVDLEAFTEIMLRNYTKRKAGLILDSTDEWLQGFFESIYQGVFGRISKHLAGADRIYWQAEGYFHFLPLDLIAISCGSTADIANIPLIEVADAAAIGKSPNFFANIREFGALLVANPEYDQEGQQNRGDSIYDDSTVKLVSRAFSNRSLSFADLPGADEEVDRLSHRLNAAGFNNVHVLRNKEASEATLLEKLSNTGMAHIATHGFYLDMTLATDERGKQLVNELKNSTNPYFRSGLALAGANATLAEWSKGNVKGTSTDGVLLASEVKDLNLNNLSLLVLSACSTAEGKPVDGKSVASLREAFLQAGVETLVSTLWDIPDDFAAKLMGDFYQRLLAGDTPSVALWHAKKDNFLELRKNNGFAESMVKVAPFVAVTQAAKAPHFPE